jgi:membrane protein implicated in regulation of membrane protease activity
MATWLIWLIVAAGFSAGELMSGSAFYLAPFALGAALAAAVDAAIGDVAAVIVFIVASIATLVLVRPIVQSRLFSGPTTHTNAKALIGQSAVVLEPVSSGHGEGRVKIGGEVWSARSFDAGREIPAGTEVQVVKIEGATALVME